MISSNLRKLPALQFFKGLGSESANRWREWSDLRAQDTPLIAASKQGDVGLVESLILNGVEVKKGQAFSWQPTPHLPLLSRVTGDLNIDDDRPSYGGTDEATIELLKSAGLIDTFLPNEGSIDWGFVSVHLTKRNARRRPGT